MPKNIILDCDPGYDDAIAMLLAHGSPEIELLAVTTVAGNQTLDKVTRNALSVATLARMREEIVAAGAHRGLVEPQHVADMIHGESGLDGVRLPEPAVALSARHAVDVIIDLVMASEPGQITLVPTGPLTNIALAARKEPRIVDRVGQVVLMGGAARGGNWSAASEFNIGADPEAAHIVFGEHWPVAMIGLDVTHRALATPDVIDMIDRVDSPVSRFAVDVLSYFQSAYSTYWGADSPSIHDACAVAYVIDPTLVETVDVPLHVELRGELTRGMTVADLRSRPDGGPTTRVGVSLDPERLWKHVIAAIETLSEVAR
ncbi:nucleoside hydrolase [Saccharopolyspora sp. K220]|uniref:nucleoside hydrolase n=1 Tax=Saccharopolyspora soli TaxID=2926618 RepID=UPI001F598466|nr:nucleoside hydrolase [Saccharopolyspora soli]MCI2423848.1 nucleoside hydrolase [Saccharopolyspora soli]